MDLLAANLASILLTGVGLSLALLGYRLVRFHALTMGVVALAGAGAAGGVLLNSPLATTAFALGGAILGYFLGPLLWHVYVAVVAGLGGTAIGLVITTLTHPSNPPLVVASTAVACAAIALLDAKAITIAWTSLAGSCIAISGILRTSPMPVRSMTVGAIFAALVVVSLLFQFRTNRGEPEAPAPAPKPKAPPAPRRSPETVGA